MGAQVQVARFRSRPSTRYHAYTHFPQPQVTYPSHLRCHPTWDLILAGCVYVCVGEVRGVLLLSNLLIQLYAPRERYEKITLLQYYKL